jgi:hypothetical protein
LAVNYFTSVENKVINYVKQRRKNIKDGEDEDNNDSDN